MALPLPNSSGRFYMENSGIDIVNERESKVFPVPSIKCDVVLLGLCDMQVRAVIVTEVAGMLTRFHVDS